MPSSVTLHIRPLDVSTSSPHVVAACEQLLLIWDNSIGYCIARIDPAEGLAAFLKLPRNLIGNTERPVQFLNGNSLCFFDGYDQNKKFVVVRSVNGNFQEHVDRHDYTVSMNLYGRTICDLEIGGEYGLMTTIDGSGAQSILELWRFSLPDWDAVDERIAMERIASTLTMSDIANWNLHAARLCARRRLHNVAWDQRDRVRHAIYFEHRAEEPPSQTGPIFWRNELANIAVSLERFKDYDFTRVDYEASVAVPLDELNQKSGVYSSGLIVKSGSRFFFDVNGIIFMGYLPGADVSLEDVASASGWRSLPLRVQTSMILDRRPRGRRDILLAAMLEESGKRADVRRSSRKRKRTTY